MIYIAPLLALIATYVMGSLTKIPMKLRPFVAVGAGVLLELFAERGYADGLQVHDFVDGVIVGLTAVGLYSGTKNVVQYVRRNPAP